MNDARAKRGIWIATLLSLLIGGALAICTYGSVLDFRSLNLIGLIYITIIGLYALMVAIQGRASSVTKQ